MSDIDRDVALSLAYLIQHQDQWEPRKRILDVYGRAFEAPLTLVGVVR